MCYMLIYSVYLHVELKAGRIADGVTKRLRYWNAEEFQKFAYPASECVLGGLLPDREYHAWVLCALITVMVLRSGWRNEDLKLLENLIRRDNILSEEMEGSTSCVITLHNLIHMPEDIQRFSAPDNYWCYSYERAVKSYIERSSNNKNLESTFAQVECRREFLKFTYPESQQQNVQTDSAPEGELVSNYTRKFKSAPV